MYKIYIPSKGRAGEVSTLGLVKKATLVVPVEEVEEYKKYYGDRAEILGCNKKGITSTRNWILDNADVNQIVMIDDDAVGVKLMGKKEVFKNNWLLDIVIDRMFLLTKEWGLKCWGLSQASDPKFYRAYSPFSTLSVIASNIIGIIRTGLRFDERFVVKEDFDFSLQQMYYYRGVLRDNRFWLVVKHLTNKGGCVSYRTQEVENKSIELLERKWGKKVVKRTRAHNMMKIIVPLHGI